MQALKDLYKNFYVLISDEVSNRLRVTSILISSWLILFITIPIGIINNSFNSLILIDEIPGLISALKLAKDEVCHSLF